MMARKATKKKATKQLTERDGQIAYSLWLPKVQLERAAALCSPMNEARDRAGEPRVNKSDVIRLAIARGLESLEANTPTEQ